MYTELHVHSNFSFPEGASHIEQLVLRALELGYEALVPRTATASSCIRTLMRASSGPSVSAKDD